MVLKVLPQLLIASAVHDHRNFRVLRADLLPSYSVGILHHPSVRGSWSVDTGHVVSESTFRNTCSVSLDLPTSPVDNHVGHVCICAQVLEMQSVVHDVLHFNSLVETEVIMALLQRFEVNVLVVAAKRLRSHELGAALCSLCLLHSLVFLDLVGKSYAWTRRRADKHGRGCVHSPSLIPK